jgi:hypothetical protein
MKKDTTSFVFSLSKGLPFSLFSVKGGQIHKYCRPFMSKCYLNEIIKKIWGDIRHPHPVPTSAPDYTSIVGGVRLSDRRTLSRLMNWHMVGLVKRGVDLLEVGESVVGLGTGGTIAWGERIGWVVGCGADTVVLFGNFLILFFERKQSWVFGSW